MAPLFSSFWAEALAETLGDDDSDAGVALPAVASVEVPVEVRDFDELEVDVDRFEFLELEDEDKDDDEDADDIVDEEVALLLEADDVVLAKAENGLKFTPVNTTCKSISEACPSYVVSTKVAS